MVTILTLSSGRETLARAVPKRVVREPVGNVMVVNGFLVMSK